MVQSCFLQNRVIRLHRKKMEWMDQS
uniref:Uncharacterized protein n=1 Tax=Arundo donax TaxID=35708 RepID=A0A0A9HEV7_ARUDO